MLTKVFKIKGMTCAACSSKISKAVKKVAGVQTVSVELLKNTCTVIFDETQTTSDDIILAIVNSGYEANENNDESNYSVDKDLIKQDKVNLLKSVICVCILMMFSFAHMLDIQIIENAYANACVQGLIALYVCLVQKQYFIHAYSSLKHFSTNMDTLVSIGALGSFLYSLYQLCSLDFNDVASVLYTTRPIFFEGTAGILTFVSIGKFIERKGKYATTSAIRALYDLAPVTATIKQGNEEKIVSLKSIKVGDVIIVKQGQRLGVDGKVIHGQAYIDESALTGESKPVKKIEGSTVSSATMVLDGYIEVEAVNVGQDTTLSKIIKLVEKTSQSQVPIARVADVMASYFVPCVIVLSVLTFGTWLVLLDAPFDRALSFALSVVVVSCPCALGLATPVAIMAGTGKAAKQGIIFKTPEALEELSRATLFAFDKTGTLTEGNMSVVDIVSIDESVPANMVSLLAASLEAKNPHPLARAIVKHYSNSNLLNVDEYAFHTSKGITGKIATKLYGIGSKYLLSDFNVQIDERTSKIIDAIQAKGQQVVILFSEDSVIACICISDSLKEDSAALVTKLHDKHMKTTMLTGDDETIAKDIASTLKIESYEAKLMPEEKFSVIEKLQNKGDVVVMVGDGINDSISLCKSDIGIGFKGSTDIALSSCDVVILHNRMLDIYNAFEISKATMLNIKQNLFWALIYNMIAIPVACGALYTSFGIYLTPMLCSILMGCSSLCVVANACRLNYMKLDDFNYKTKDVRMKKTVMIDGMSCSHCTASVCKSLQSLPSATNVEVSLESKNAKLEISDAISDEMIKATIESAGFKVTGIVVND